MHQINLDLVVDVSHYENIDRMQTAFVTFTDNIIREATEMGIEVPYENWYQLWKAFQKTELFLEGLRMRPPGTEPPP